VSLLVSIRASGGAGLDVIPSEPCSVLLCVPTQPPDALIETRSDTKTLAITSYAKVTDYQIRLFICS
jgi:hypothetical protein